MLVPTLRRILVLTLVAWLGCLGSSCADARELLGSPGGDEPSDTLDDAWPADRPRMGEEPRPLPAYYRAILDKVDESRCGPSNCEACGDVTCAQHPDHCVVRSEGVPCGPACDGAIRFCVPIAEE